MLRSKYRKRELYQVIFYIIVISLSISPACLTSEVDSRNYLLILCMCFGPIILVKTYKKKLDIDKKTFIFLLLLFLIPVLFNTRSIRMSSLLFTCMFICYFLAGIHCALKGQITCKNIAYICKVLIICYCIVLILQQICVLLHLPIINVLAYKPETPWKLNSLSAEPSHTSRYVGILMYAFLTCQKVLKGDRGSFIKSFEENKLIWTAFLWIMLTSGSGTAIIVLGLVLSIYSNKKNVILYSALVVGILIIGISSDMTALKRSTTFLTSILSGNSESMIAADHSASIRIVPWILCLQHIHLFSIRSWIGEGMGSTSLWMSDYMPGVPAGWTGGGIANMLVEYGLIVGIYYLIYSFRCCYCNQNKICTVGLWVICVVLIGINMQIAWLCMLMLFIVNKLDLKDEDKSILQST